MKATVIMGSPRGTKGASSRIATHFAAGLRRAGAEVEEILLKDYAIKHCLGCFTCWTKTPGRCVHRDDMDRLLPKLHTDLIVWATPLYYYSVPGLMKDFLDRMLPTVEPFLIERGDTTGHPLRNASQTRKSFLISVAGFPERSHFDALVATFQQFSPNLLGKILIGWAEPISQEMLQGTYTELYELVEQAGYEVVINEKMSQETEQAIIAKTTYSQEQITQLRSVANAYWKAQLDSSPGSKEITVVSNTPVSLSDGGMATFLAGMAMQYNPKAIPDFAGVIQFSFEKETYHLLIQEGMCSAYAGEHPEPTMTILTPEQLWLDIAEGKLDGAKALMDGLYTTEGDMSLLMKLDQLFTPETTAHKTDVKNGEYPTEHAQNQVHTIPNNRGPLSIQAMTWLTVAFLPWMILWIGEGFLPRSIPRYAATGMAVLIAGYHLLTNAVTWFEAGTAIYFGLSSLVMLTGWGFFWQLGRVIDYIFLGGLWFGSLARSFALTAEYSRYQFPKPVWSTRTFQDTNAIITAVWGAYFLVAALLNLIAAIGFGSQLALTLMTYGLLIPMFIFTSKFQQWYPQHVMQTS